MCFDANWKLVLLVLTVKGQTLYGQFLLEKASYLAACSFGLMPDIAS